MRRSDQAPARTPTCERSAESRRVPGQHGPNRELDERALWNDGRQPAPIRGARSSTGAHDTRLPTARDCGRRQRHRSSRAPGPVSASRYEAFRTAAAIAPTAIPHALPISRPVSDSITGTPAARAASKIVATRRRSESRATKTTVAIPRRTAFVVWFDPTARRGAALSSSNVKGAFTSRDRYHGPLLRTDSLRILAIIRSSCQRSIGDIGRGRGACPAPLYWTASFQIEAQRRVSPVAS